MVNYLGINMGIDKEHQELSKKQRLSKTAKAGMVGYVDAWQSKNGNLKILDDEKCIERKVHHDGQYTEVSPGNANELGGVREMVGRHNRAAEGTTLSTIGNDDTVTTGGVAMRDGNGGRHYHTSGSTSSAVAGSHVAVDNHSARVSVAEQYHASERSASTLEGSDGFEHENVSKDSVKYIAGTQYTQIGGEKGCHLPSGNYDIQVDNGNFRIYCKKFIIDAEEIEIKTRTKTITIDSNENVIVKASEAVITKTDNGTFIDAGQITPTSAGFNPAGKNS